MTLVNGAEAAKQMGVSRWFISSLKRAGVPISLAMAYVGHANETIHRVYQRLKPGDVGPAVAALSGI